MSHLHVLMVETETNLMQIYADCPDSSNETKAEMAFAYDYLCPIEKDLLLGKKVKGLKFDYEFTKQDTELYDKIVLDERFIDCFDIRDNTSNHRIRDHELKKFFKSLPDDTHFFVCDGHL